jgi:hypothetical protein
MRLSEILLEDEVATDPQFSQWFGNSVVVDKKTGKPLLVYHGTSHDFDTFDTKAAPVHRNDDIEGTYFSPSPEYAYSFARRGSGPRKRLISAYLKIQNPLNITPLIKKFRRKGMTFGNAKREAMKMVDRSVHDGVVFDGDSYNIAEYIIFRPDQVWLKK